MNISHGCFAGSLGQFDALRLVWSHEAGYGVIDCDGVVMPNIDYRVFGDEDLLGEWPAGAPDDPLVILLAHDERNGRIKMTHCPYLADRLEELEGNLMKRVTTGTVPIWVLLTQQFVRGLRTAAAYSQDVVFS